MVMEFPISPPYWFKANPMAISEAEDELQRALIVLLGRDKEESSYWRGPMTKSSTARDAAVSKRGWESVSKKGLLSSSK